MSNEKLLPLGNPLVELFRAFLSCHLLAGLMLSGRRKYAEID